MSTPWSNIYIIHIYPNDKERRESLWIEALQTLNPYGLNFK